MIKKIPVLILVLFLLINNIVSASVDNIQNPEDYISLESISKEVDEINWIKERGIIEVKNNNKIFKLRIDSKLINYMDKNDKYFLSDLPPIIVEEKVYIPKNTYNKINGEITPIYKDEIINIKNGQTIEGKIQLETKISKENESIVSEVKYLLLDRETVTGRIIGKGKITVFVPHYKDSGSKILVSALYDKNGNLIGGDAKAVNVDLKPEIRINGLKDIIKGDTPLKLDINFVPSYIKYEMMNLDNGKADLTSEIDPWGEYKWSPQVEDSGNYRIRAIAYDENRKICVAKVGNIKLDISHKLGLTGIKENMIVDKPVTLMATRNFNVLETEYILRNPETGEEEILSKQGYGSYKWFPGPDHKGKREILTRVKDLSGTIHETKGVPVNLPGNPKLILEGVGPKQVITSTVEIKTLSNFSLDAVEYILTNENKATKKTLTSKNPTMEYKYTPIEDDKNYTHIKAVGQYKDQRVESESIPINIYLGQIYGPKPIIEKDKFLDLASELAVEAWKNTSMSAALQTSQAILETGWGQSVPVDKYTGKFSYNLFGIKGSATAGSVISNTWEEYNGTVFRIDDEFRAYNNINESWLNHKDLLLKAERYGIFRDVMYDSTMGAWAIRRAGYATDSQYPIKLMKIIRDYNLEELDKITI